jgi:hypothetical protein
LELAQDGGFDLNLINAPSFLVLYYIVNHLWPNPDTVFAPQLLFLRHVLGGADNSLPYHHRLPGFWLAERDKTCLLRQGAWVGFFASCSSTTDQRLTIVAVVAYLF